MNTVSIQGREYKNSTRIGDLGESIVTAALDGAININYPSHQKLPYDVIWNNHKINVKFSTSTLPSGRVYFHFHYKPIHKGIIFVCVTPYRESYKFWVIPAQPKLPRGYIIETGYNTDELPELINRCTIE